ncbi:MAG: molybdenum cofactor guanylyltransferase, partial [Candidatus Helarchaeota archaeon]
MDLSVVILAGGRAKRLGVDKALIVIKDKPLIGHTFGKIQPLSEDILIVTKSEKREKKLRQVIKAPVRFLIDEDPSIESPLIGALTGIKKAKNELVLLIGCDMPLIKHEVIEKLYKYITGVKALCLA